jgi:hypothetical protein
MDQLTGAVDEHPEDAQQMVDNKPDHPHRDKLETVQVKMAALKKRQWVGINYLVDANPEIKLQDIYRDLTPLQVLQALVEMVTNGPRWRRSPPV